MNNPRTIKEASAELGESHRDITTVILARGIPTKKIGSAHVLDDKGIASLRDIFENMRAEAKSRGMIRGLTRVASI